MKRNCIILLFALVLLASPMAYGECNKLNCSVITYWSFDNDDKNSTHIYDMVGRYNGTINATTSQPGFVRQSYYFDGDTDRIAPQPKMCQTLFSGNTSGMAISIMWKAESITYSSQYTWSDQIFASSNELLTAFSSDAGNYIRFELYGNPNTYNLYTNGAGSDFQTDTWYHMVITWGEDDVMKIYINGVLNNSNTDQRYPSPDCTGSHSLQVGNSPTGDYGFNGWLDEFFVYNKSLSSDEVAFLYANLTKGISYPFYSPIVTPAFGIYVNITTPLNNTGFGIADLSATHSQVWINGTHNSTATTDCYTNDTRFTGYGANPSMGYNFTFKNNTLISNGLYWVKLQCNLTNNITGSAIVNFTLDINNPVIDPLDLLETNQTVVYNGTLSTQINFSDNLEIYSINISLLNGTVLAYVSNYGAATNTTYINYTLDDKHQTLQARVCDAHTAAKIKQADDIRYGNAGVKYVIKDNPFLQLDEWIYIYPKNYLQYNKASSAYEGDRYSPIFNRKTPPIQEETFVIEASHPLDVITSQRYPAHIVAKDIGDNGYWIDLDIGGSGYAVRQINKYKVEVDVSGLKGSEFVSNSIGELNCITKQYAVGNLHPVEDASSYVIMRSNNTFSLNVSYDPRTMSALNATLYYNNTPYYAGTSKNFSVGAVAPTISGNSTNISYNWVIDANGASYNLTYYQQNVSNFFFDNCVAYTTQAYLFRTRYAVNDSITPAETTYSWVYYTNGINKTYNLATNGNTSQPFCIYPIYISMYTDFYVEYSIAGYDTQTYEWNKETTDNVSDSRNLYLVGDTDFVIVTVYDELDNVLENVWVQVLQYQTINGSWITVSNTRTDYLGQAYSYLNLYDTWYIFNLTYNGRVVKTTTKTKLSSTSLEFRVNIGTIPELITLSLYDIPITLTTDRANNNINLSWTTVSYAANDIKLVILRINSANGTETVSSQSLPGNNQKLGYHISASTKNMTVSYVANVYVNSSVDNLYYYLKSESLDFMQQWDVFGLVESVAASFVLIGTMFFAGLAFDPLVAILLGIVGIIISYFMGLLFVSKLAVGGVVVALIIMLGRMRKKY